MSDTQGLLDRIAALRREPEYPTTPSTAKPTAAPASSAERLAALQKQVGVGYRHDAAVERLVRQATGSPRATVDTTALPQQVTSRLRRLLDRGRALVLDLRQLAGEPLLQREGHTLTSRYAETAAMADVALRLLQSFPDAPSAQLHLCAGLEGILRTIDERVAELLRAVVEHRHEQETLHTLAAMFRHLHDEQPVEFDSLVILADGVLSEARSGVPLRVLDPEGDDVAAWIAAHSLTTARVAAQMVHRHPEFRHRAADFVLAALSHDVGMLGVSREVLALPQPLGDEARRQIELHTLRGRDLLRQGLLGAPEWLAECAATHHERPDGTGYPAGLRDVQISPLSRLLAVCDVYAALACARPYRPAHDPRRAMIEVLALAERGLLDRAWVAELLELSFYPTGVAVELSDGSVGVVVGTHTTRRDVSSMARPLIALLLDTAGQPVQGTHVVDLHSLEGRSVVRALPAKERSVRLGRWFTEWAR